MSGDLVAFSDRRFKTDIQRIEQALDKVEQIAGYTFKTTLHNEHTNKITERHMGVIAQEVESILPELIHEDKNGYKSVAYANLTALLIEAIKELKQKIEDIPEGKIVGIDDKGQYTENYYTAQSFAIYPAAERVILPAVTNANIGDFIIPISINV